MKRILKGLFRIVEIFVIIYVIMICTSLLCYNKYGYVEVIGDTIVPSGEGIEGFPKDSLVVFTRKAYKKMELDTEVYYYDNVKDKYVIKKGIVKEISGQEGDESYRFDKTDSFVPKSNIVGVHQYTLPLLGKVKRFLESTTGYVFFVFLPIFVVFCYEICDLIITIKRDNEEGERLKKQEEIEVLTI